MEVDVAQAGNALPAGPAEWQTQVVAVDGAQSAAATSGLLAVVLLGWVAATALAHARQHGFDHRHRAKHIDVKLAAQLCKRGFFQNAFMAVTGIVHQHIQPAEPGDGGGDQFVDLARIRDIDEMPHGALPTERRHDGLVSLLAHIGHHHRRAFGMQTPHRGFADAGASAGHDRHLPGQRRAAAIRLRPVPQPISSTSACGGASTSATMRSTCSAFRGAAPDIASRTLGMVSPLALHAVARARNMGGLPVT